MTLTSKDPRRQKTSGSRDHVALKALTVAGSSAGGIALITGTAGASGVVIAGLGIVVFGVVLVVAILALRNK